MTWRKSERGQAACGRPCSSRKSANMATVPGSHGIGRKVDAASHRTCQQNLEEAVAPFDVEPDMVPDVFNIFMRNDEGATFDKEIDVDASAVSPLVSCVMPGAPTADIDHTFICRLARFDEKMI